MRSTEIAVIGAGPYGLSVAAHLAGAGVPFRIVGRVMETWRDQMPVGMLLKSDGFASNLSDPKASFELHHFCSEQSIPYDHTRVPVSLETFARYGVEFQQRLLPGLEEEKLASLERRSEGFLLRLESGEEFAARKVVLATGICYYAHVPSVLASLPAKVLSHSSGVCDPGAYCGKSVAIVGSGASALDLAALLHEAGAKVQVLARRGEVKFHNPPGDKPRPFLQRLRAPGSGIGPGWKSRLLTEFPGLFRLLPLAHRLRVVKRYLGPSAGWPMRERVVGKVTILTGVTPRSAELRDGKAHLALSGADGTSTEITVDHVIAATGYQVDLRRLPFLNEALRQQIASAEHTPLLSAAFESSVPGLFFVGISAASTFGPVMRFAFGAEYAATKVSRHLARSVRRQPRVESAPVPVT